MPITVEFTEKVGWKKCPSQWNKSYLIMAISVSNSRESLTGRSESVKTLQWGYPLKILIAQNKYPSKHGYAQSYSVSYSCWSKFVDITNMGEDILFELLRFSLYELHCEVPLPPVRGFGLILVQSCGRKEHHQLCCL